MPRKKELITRTEKVAFRLTRLEKTAIELSARETGLSTSAYARKAALNMKVTIRFTPEEFAVYKDLQTYHRNFKYLSNLIRSKQFNKNEQIIDELNQIITLIKSHLKKFES